MTERELQLIVDKVKQCTRTQAYGLELELDKEPGLFDSKLGGVPYWDCAMEYPTDSEGNKLLLLAQLNFEQDNLGELFPNKGMLQFFILPDDEYGLNFEEADKQDTFRVVYHETLKQDVKKEDVLNLDIPVADEEDGFEGSPVFGEFALEVTQQETYTSEGGYDLEEICAELRKEHADFTIGSETPFEEVEDEIQDHLFDELLPVGNWVLGHAYFTQNDPREYEKKYRRYDTLLLQIDTNETEDGEECVMWGDCGVGNFFINREDLLKRDFSKVLYNWDCC